MRVYNEGGWRWKRTGRPILTGVKGAHPKRRTPFNTGRKNKRNSVKRNTTTRGETKPKVNKIADLLIMTLNVNGLRQKRKITALGTYLSTLERQPEVCILAETHLVENETEGIKLDTYRKAHSHCREEEVEKSCGGVLIMVKKDASFKKDEERQGVSLPLNSCSILLFLNNPEMPVVRLTGVYFTPSAKPRVEQVEMLTGGRSAVLHEGSEMGHIIAGDLNHPSGQGQYSEWIGMHGIWELTDPNRKTFAAGNALDKFLFRPGEAIPSCFLKHGTAWNDGDLKEDFYPGETGDQEEVGNRHPVYLKLPYGASPQPHPIRRLHIKGIADEDWKKRNQRLGELILAQEAALGALEAKGDATRIYEMLLKHTNQVVGDLYTRKKSRKQERAADLFAQFCKQHAKHPKITELEIYHHAKNVKAEEQLMNSILREEWRGYLARVKPCNTTGIYKYIRKKDGRESGTFAHQCSAPIIEEGKVYTNPKEKCEKIAEYFATKFTQPREDEPNEPKKLIPQQDEDQYKVYASNGKQNGAQRSQGKGGNAQKNERTKQFVPFREVEITKAVGDSATGKAPGPDGLPGDLFKLLPAVIPVVTRLAKTAVRTGNIPKPMRLIRLAPLDKPGKDEHRCASKRPISLINTLTKIIETVAYNRVIHAVEAAFHPAHYAYRRQRGTNVHLFELAESMGEQLARNKYVWLASLDIQGAFDGLYHDKIERAVRRAGMEDHCADFINSWTRGRSFQVEINTNNGTYLSRLRNITRGLPQGGILSPMLWVLVFSEFSEIVEGALSRRPYFMEHGIYYKFCIYADDVAVIIAHAEADILTSATGICHIEIEKALNRLDFGLSKPKCNNMIAAPGEVVGGYYRRNNGLSSSVNKKLPERDARLRSLVQIFDENRLPLGAFPPKLKAELPYATPGTFKILGVAFDENLGFGAHYDQVSRKAGIRHGIMATLARRAWGLEVGIMRSAHSALLTSLLTYGLAAIGGGGI